MLLYVMRHGIAADATDATAAADAQRPLTDEGRHRVGEVAAGLARLEVQVERVLSSPLVRARQTAEIVASVLRIPASRLEVTAALSPEAAPSELLRTLAAQPPRDALCVGHAPSLDALIAALTNGEPTTFTALRKAGVACLELPHGVGARAELHWLMPPRLLRALGAGQR